MTINSFTTPRQDRTMDASNEKEQVFHPSSIPVDRDRSCLNVRVIISALSSAFIVIGAGYLINKGLQSFLFPTKPFALKPRHVDRSNASQVHPLIDATTTNLTSTRLSGRM